MFGNDVTVTGSMEGEIVGESDQGIAVDVVDNEGATHEISIYHDDGEIPYHNQDAYPDDASKRELWEDEMVSQARRYARTYVTQETEYHVVPWDFDRDRFETVREAIATLSEDELETHFREYYRQLIGYHDDDVEAPTSLPPSADPMNEYRQFRLDIYLDDADQIEATSDIHTMYYSGVDDEEIVRRDDPFPRENLDAQLQHVNAEFDWDDMPEFLDYHLRCQIRDCYIGAGLEPPEEYRLLGPGLSTFTPKYMHFEFYPRYHEYDADVEGYRAEDTFNFGALGDLLEFF